MQPNITYSPKCLTRLCLNQSNSSKLVSTYFLKAIEEVSIAIVLLPRPNENTEWKMIETTLWTDKSNLR